MLLFNQYKSDFKKNLQLAFPVMLSQIGQITVNQADTIMLGRLGSENLAAVSIANAVFILILVFGMGIANALTPLVAEADGKKDKQKAGSLFFHGIALNTVISIVLSTLMIIGLPFLIYTGQPQEVIELAIPYLEISTYSFLPFMIFFTIKQYADGLGLTKYGMYATLIGNVVNIVFNYLLIYGKFGFPELKMEGAAWGTFISRVVMAIIMFALLVKTPLLIQPLKKVQVFFSDKKRYYNILKLGIPSSLQHLFEIGAFSAAAFIAGLVGTKTLAAHHVALNLATFTFLLCQGFAVAATVRVGNLLGKGDYKGLRKAGISSGIQVITFMGICGIIFILARNWLPLIYVEEQEVIELASVLLVVASLFQLSDGGQVVMLGALRGLQDVKIPTIITFFAYWVFALPGSYLLAITFDMGAIGIWASLGVGLSLSAIFLAIRFNKLSNLKISNN